MGRGMMGGGVLENSKLKVRKKREEKGRKGTQKIIKHTFTSKSSLNHGVSLGKEHIMSPTTPNILNRGIMEYVLCGK